MCISFHIYFQENIILTYLRNTFLSLSHCKRIKSFQFTLSYYYFLYYLTRKWLERVWTDPAKIVLFLYFQSVVSPKVMFLNYNIIVSQVNGFAELKFSIKEMIFIDSQRGKLLLNGIQQKECCWMKFWNPDLHIQLPIWQLYLNF